MPQEKILVVDDDPDICHTLKRFLASLGYQVATAACGREALTVMGNSSEDSLALVILDLVLPDLSGLDLLAHFRQATPDTEVILFTGEGGMDSAIQALRLGAYDYLVKTDFRLPELQSTVERALERRRLALANRKLLTDLKRAQEELAATRARELTQIRRIGEALARPHSVPALLLGLVDLIWESLPLLFVAARIREPGPLQFCRHAPSLGAREVERFENWVAGQLPEMSAKRVASPSRRSKGPFPGLSVLRENLGEEPAVGLAVAARREAFSPEESELFRIFALQGSAALKNVLLFEEVKGLAIRDGLTGLYNYRHFREMLAHQVELSRRYDWPLSLLFLDLDNFKVINDTFGHPEGDVVLRTVAHFLKTHLRQADILCRYGGEEFVALLPQTPLVRARFLAERLRLGLAQTPISLSVREIYLTVSIGLAELTKGMAGDDLVKAADAALLRAKQSGKNCVFGPEG
jgi:diguanylate cyclase (GGDEF)-like protein